MSKKTLYSIPKINTANGDLSKRWYVYFSFRNPETGKMKRMSNIYGRVNSFKTKEARLFVLKIYRKRLLHFLKLGYNPFEDNTQLYQNLQKESLSKPIVEENKEKPKIVNNLSTDGEQQLQQIIDKLKEVVITVKDNTDLLYSESKQVLFNQHQNWKNEDKPLEESETTKMFFSEAFDFALELKQKEVSKTTLNDYKRKIKKFLGWLEINQPKKKYIDQIKRKDILDFLNSILLKTSPRTRNNYKSDLSSVFQVLKNNELVKENYLKTVKTLNTKPEKNKRYTNQQQKEIFIYLEKEDPLLLLYIQFIYYGFMRPLEVSRLKIKDIDLENRTMQFQSKTNKVQTKRIPEILIKKLPVLSHLNQDDFLFTPEKIGGDWIANEYNRRDHFTKRFSKIVKNQFNLKENYGLYSFRHTAVTRLYNNLKNEMTEYEARSKLMPITGHKTMIALEKYLRDIEADLPEDYSDLFNIETL
ncbi:site-specific integrase [Polaribacter vadi]|uniref:tyrosine-type recombinase/integrase n=1 Tax=Polaribacter TaxID=52959 RepID=UPI001C0A5D49|nr:MULTISPECIES: tyrosine-type recombinase/integrase [Polaribacter]MBU3012272.1 site-specific integrase [Polaribacter vadi]MDO6742089.1 phage integrase N-terminal SAM-like domain-containing protein [Polaribacter sp. 1_MG-2023]